MELFTQEEEEKAFQLLRDAIDMDERFNPVENTIAFLQRVELFIDESRAPIVQSVIKLVEGRISRQNPQTSVDGTLATKLYNIVKGRCNTINNNSITKKFYLMRNSHKQNKKLSETWFQLCLISVYVTLSLKEDCK
jgi:hypothetical protein